MTSTVRTALALLLSASALGLAAHVAALQSQNFREAAELDELSVAAEWNARRTSGIKPELRRFEFDLSTEQTRARGMRTLRVRR